MRARFARRGSRGGAAHPRRRHRAPQAPLSGATLRRRGAERGGGHDGGVRWRHTGGRAAREAAAGGTSGAAARGRKRGSGCCGDTRGARAPCSALRPARGAQPRSDDGWRALGPPAAARCGEARAKTRSRRAPLLAPHRLLASLPRRARSARRSLLRPPRRGGVSQGHTRKSALSSRARARACRGPKEFAGGNGGKA